MGSGGVQVVRALADRFRVLVSELSKFGLVGVMAVALDVAVFNVVLIVAPGRPLPAKALGTLVSATFAFALNRAWSFRHRGRTTLRREYLLYALFNAIGLAIALSCLVVSHYVLGFQSRLADNIAGNVVGLALGTAFRFWSYRRFVWTQVTPVEESWPAPETSTSTA